MIKRLLLIGVAVLLTVAVTSCESEITASLDVTYYYPFCPTTDSIYIAVDSVPLGCPTPLPSDTTGTGP